ncbi:hypothetical protein DFJ77DRAFT_450474 [Powellomyces hirtus]|nr:hypothetical protein DFJ77DRAFT_450474 [Powellomyces hirtus]
MEAISEPYYPHPPSVPVNSGPPSQSGSDGTGHHPHAQMFPFQIPPYGYPARHHGAEYQMPMYRAVNMAERRAYHNATERARRENLNHRFQELAQALPSLISVRKPSKSVIVNHSLQFVTDVKRKMEIKDRALNSLRNQNAALLTEMNKLKEILGLPQTPAPDMDEDLQEKADQEAAAAAAALKQEMLQAEAANAENASTSPQMASSSLSPSLQARRGSDTTEDGEQGRRDSLAPAAEQSVGEQQHKGDPSPNPAPNVSSLEMTALTNSFSADQILSEASIFQTQFEHHHMPSTSKDSKLPPSYVDVSFGPRETPTPPNGTPIIQQDPGAPPHPAEYACVSQDNSPYAHHLQLHQHHQQLQPPQQQQQQHPHRPAQQQQHHPHQQHQHQHQHPQHPHHGADMAQYNSMPRRAYSFDASYLPGMQAAMNSLGGDMRFHQQH